MGGLFLGAWVVVVLWYVVGMIKAGETESEVVVTPEYFEVISAHGVRAPIGAITAVELREDIPDIGSKIRGYNSLTCVKKGEFEVEGMGAGRVYIFTDEGPFVHIFMGDQFVIIGLEDPAHTRQLHQELLNVWQRRMQ